MNLTKLFETQKKLDERIIKEKGLEGQDLLPMKILALQVELGELANEWRGFKFWSEKNKPVVRASNPIEHGNPMLEEYVDCLHFILSIGNDLGFSEIKPYWVRVIRPLAEFRDVSRNIVFLEIPGGREHKRYHYENLFSNFLALGKSLNFTWDQIETAYFEKNRINHARQSSNY